MKRPKTFWRANGNIRAITRGTGKRSFSGRTSAYRLETYNAASHNSTVMTGTYRYDEDQFVLQQRTGMDYAFDYSVSGDSLFTMNKIYLRQ
ncbi:MAG: hypothetical protein U5N26_10945 [Candidatus Marinimicrobia bacterium]|nr:hypothetical protein [Candidatus Neomarinimicrobiota bacterium]